MAAARGRRMVVVVYGRWPRAARVAGAARRHAPATPQLAAGHINPVLRARQRSVPLARQINREPQQLDRPRPVAAQPEEPRRRRARRTQR